MKFWKGLQNLYIQENDCGVLQQFSAWRRRRRNIGLLGSTVSQGGVTESGITTEPELKIGQYGDVQAFDVMFLRYKEIKNSANTMSAQKTQLVETHVLKPSQKEKLHAVECVQNNFASSN